MSSHVSPRGGAISLPKRVVYVCHGYSLDPIFNAERICKVCRSLVHEGRVPIAPQLLLPQFIHEETERDLALMLCFEFIALAEEVWVYGDPTDGMRMEIAEAERLRIPVVQKDLPGDREADENGSRQRPETVNNQQRVIGSEKGTRALGDRGIKSLGAGG